MKPYPENAGKKHKTRNLTVSLYPGDHELVEWMVEFLGSSRSDAVRAAIRAFAMSLQEIERKQKS